MTVADTPRMLDFTTTTIAEPSPFECGCLPCQLRQNGSDPAGGPDSSGSDGSAQVRWSGVLGVEGELTGDGRLIEPGLLTGEERSWLDLYHARVLAEIGPALDGAAMSWLKQACAPLF